MSKVTCRFDNEDEDEGDRGYEAMDSVSHDVLLDGVPSIPNELAKAFSRGGQREQFEPTSEQDKRLQDSILAAGEEIRRRRGQLAELD